MLAGVIENIRDDPHRGFGRINIGVPHHELFQNIVLNGACQLLGLNALLFSGHHIKRQDRQNSAVHGHRHAHLVQGNAIKQGAHIQYAVDGHTRHAHITRHTLMITVIAAVGGKIKGDRQALLARSQIATVKGVAVFRG